MATSKKKKSKSQKAPAAPKSEAKVEAAAKDPEGSAAPAAEAPAEPTRFERDKPKRSEDEAKQIRVLLKKAEKALEQIDAVLGAFEPAPERSVKNAMKRLAQEIDALKPPEPRRCKEYKRAITLARKGEMGIHPDDVMRYCRCSECHDLREKAGLDHPLAPRAAS